jgi:hypothetical protein
MLEDQYAHDTRDQEKIAAHNGYYNNFIRQAWQQRRSTSRVPDDDLHLGLDPWAGMGTGDPGFKPKPEPLWLADANMPAKCAHFKGFPADVASSMPPFEVCRPHVATPHLCCACLRIVPSLCWYPVLPCTSRCSCMQSCPSLLLVIYDWADIPLFAG